MVCAFALHIVANASNAIIAVLWNGLVLLFIVVRLVLWLLVIETAHRRRFLHNEATPGVWLGFDLD